MWSLKKGKLIINPLGSVRFNLANDMFKEIIRAPASLQSRQSCYYGYHCCVVKDCLSFAAMFEDDHSIELWVMKEYGLEGSWTKLHRLGLFHVLQNPHRWLSAFKLDLMARPWYMRTGTYSSCIPGRLEKTSI